MTTRFSAPYESAANAESTPTARIVDEGPYARPAAVPPQRAVDAVLIDAIRASVGPFVPAPWRGASVTPASTDESEGLPWIESFMDRTTEAAADDVDAAESLPSVELHEAGESDATGTVDFESPLEAAVEAAVEAAAEAAAEAIVAAQVTPNSAEEWPLEEAGAAMRALADDLVRQDDAPTPASGDESNGSGSSDASSASLRMWTDDDMMDIMPVKASEAPTEGGEQWAARARRETEAAGTPESAAQALETLARRVRSGEIQLPVFSAEMGEAAALAAALAALLSVRR